MRTAHTADEVATETVFDGAGRTLKTRTANPNSTGGYTGKMVEYDMLGRAFRENVPTEMDSRWNSAGDDYRGNTWLWNTTEFDWKGRPSRTIPSDSNGSDNKDTLYTYEGCGCAGGQITTVKGPVTTAIDVAGTTQTTKRRTQKIHADILGRTAKTELWDLDGAGSAPYSTVKNTYNGRDQVTLIEEFVGGTSGTHQDTTMSYDGHGRPSQVHKPEWFEGSTLKYQTTTYNADDTVATVTDPRGAVTTYSYGNTSISEKRAVLLGISYTVPSGSGIPVPSNIAFTYDNAGNRTFMSDGTGTLTYAYDELSRLKTETKDFTDSLADAPNGGVYTLTYDYHLTGGLKSIKDPWNNEVTYSADSVGRTTSIGANNFTGRTNGTEAFASDIEYRSFGMMKSMNYTTDTVTAIAMTYDTGLRLSTYQATSSANAGDIQNRNYYYHNGGTLNAVSNAADAKFGQVNEYDFAGRLKKNDFGTPYAGVPYRQAISYDAFDNITSRTTWDKDSNQRSYTVGFTNNRKSSGGGYGAGSDTLDAAGNIIQNHFYDGANNDRTWKFDAAGRMTDWLESLPYVALVDYWDEGSEFTFDGDGRTAKSVKRFRHRMNSSSGYIFEKEYKIISSVTGKPITDLDETGKKIKTNVYMGGSVIADQSVSESTGYITFKHVDPLTGSSQATGSDGVIFPYDVAKIELDPLGTWANPSEAEITAPSGNYKNGGRIDNPEMGCADEMGAPMPCNVAAALENHLRNIDPNYWKKHGDLLPLWLQPFGNGPTLDPDSVFADNVRRRKKGLRFQAYRKDDRAVEEWIVDPSGAGAGSATQSGEKLGFGVPTNIKSLVLEMSERAKCRDFLEGLKNALAGYGDLLEVPDGTSFIEAVYDSIKRIEINPTNAGSGATTNGKTIWLRDVNRSNKTFANNHFAKYVLQELVHKFKAKGTYDDAKLDKAAFDFLDKYDPIKGASERKRKDDDDLADGSIAHQLITANCQYTQQEIDDDK